VRLRVRELPIPGLPAELDGLRIAHLSDLHLGVPSRGKRAVEKAIDWVAERKPDLVCITGDLLSRPKGEPHLLELLARLDHPYIVLGNHDYAISRDPFSKPVELRDLEHGTILLDQAVRVGDVELGGVDPRSWMEKRPNQFPDSDASISKLTTYYANHHAHVVAGGMVFSFATILLAVFGCALWSRARTIRPGAPPAMERSAFASCRGVQSETHCGSPGEISRTHS